MIERCREYNKKIKRYIFRLVRLRERAAVKKKDWEKEIKDEEKENIDFFVYLFGYIENKM